MCFGFNSKKNFLKDLSKKDQKIDVIRPIL